MRLKDKTAVVTGGRAGIGRAIVEAFVNEGAIVTTCGRSHNATDLPDGCCYRPLDVADTNAVKAFVSTFDHIDILVNNAGVQVEKTTIDSSIDHQHRLHLWPSCRSGHGFIQRFKGVCAWLNAFHRCRSRPNHSL